MNRKQTNEINVQYLSKLFSTKNKLKLIKFQLPVLGNWLTIRLNQVS